MKKIAVFSDIHGNVEALRSILIDIAQLGIDDVICLGDVLGMGPSPSECLDLIIDNNVKLILGNHDLYAIYGASIDVNVSMYEIEHAEWVGSRLMDYHIEYLEKCALSYEFSFKNKLFGFQHFLLNDVPKGRYPFKSLKIISDGIKESFLNTKYDYLFIGHEHKSFQLDIDKKHLIDVGTSGCTKSDKTHYTVLELDEKGISITRRNLMYNRESFEARIDSMEYPERETVAFKFFGIEL